MKKNQLTKNFTLEEFTKSKSAEILKIDNTPNEEEIANIKKLCEDVLQPIRDAWGEPIYINSGYRCKKLNENVGGSKTSQHINGSAADIDSENNEKLFHKIVSMVNNGDITFDQLIDECNYAWLHIGIRTDGKPNRCQILHKGKKR